MLSRKEGSMAMSTYEELSLIISVVGLIIMILNYKEKPKK